MQSLSTKITKFKRSGYYRAKRETIKKSKIYQGFDIAGHYLSSVLFGLKNEAYFCDVETFCMFIGHGRSGHSIIGALLDAHPNVILSDETDILKYLSAGYNRKQIFYVLLKQSKKHAYHKRRKMGRDGMMYSYWVPNQFQGQHKKLQVIGDSKAGVSARKFSEKPALLDHLRV